MTTSPNAEIEALIPDACENVLFALQQTLDGIGHSWTFDARGPEICCKDCEWYAEAPFMKAIKLAERHRNDVKIAVLDVLRDILAYNPRSET